MIAEWFEMPLITVPDPQNAIGTPLEAPGMSSIGVGADLIHLPVDEIFVPAAPTPRSLRRSDRAG